MSMPCQRRMHFSWVHLAQLGDRAPFVHMYLAVYLVYLPYLLAVAVGVGQACPLPSHWPCSAGTTSRVRIYRSLHLRHRIRCGRSASSWHRSCASVPYTSPSRANVRNCHLPHCHVNRSCRVATVTMYSRVATPSASSTSIGRRKSAYCASEGPPDLSTE
ncbi:hypothetical protein C8Q74DRAFT_120016 [Fomes fomentarius]|nr:hypothetical protein C8Q74DRAFT_120016 [Fomes fomentarius]